jgi:hypothetical protein
MCLGITEFPSAATADEIACNFQGVEETHLKVLSRNSTRQKRDSADERLGRSLLMPVLTDTGQSRRSLLVYPQKQTFSLCFGMFQRCQQATFEMKEAAN